MNNQDLEHCFVCLKDKPNCIAFTDSDNEEFAETFHVCLDCQRELEILQSSWYGVGQGFNEYSNLICTVEKPCPTCSECFEIQNILEPHGHNCLNCGQLVACSVPCSVIEIEQCQMCAPLYDRIGEIF